MISLFRTTGKTFCSFFRVTANRAMLFMAACLIMSEAGAQSTKQLVLADRYYNAGEYLTAAGLYGQFLHPVVIERPFSNFPLQSRKASGGARSPYADKLDIVFKQAESYRMANYFPDALPLYKQCFDADPVKYQSSLYYMAVCQRSMGDLASAEQHLQLLSKEKLPEALRQSVEKEKAVIGFIRSELSRPDSVLFQVK